jgi:hypothetical protein
MDTILQSRVVFLDQGLCGQPLWSYLQQIFDQESQIEIDLEQRGFETLFLFASEKKAAKH